ncbi:hypothetical protein KJR69_08620 [Klebsiella pneumoniae]|uniref:hypothetical protein n=1 Tax=Klebsiella pneumoniae TaxID=573 RepID=UPI0003EB9FA1|nr:hypothetical protein [Klebsiella pneumoniae]HDE1087160.1 hypothetical protein [Klebsiella quasipneumoniae]EKX1463457.1 hypothetical protein [Klebsiella pneumoniae]ELF1738365.1 hypothetical protein [Klebsiella pneumoniae]EMF2173155.1 hypothetical protein [Klebsiella pneumoniae]EWD00145.1 hypothetical protein X657_4744 [Klebsiella pneumoniae NB60]
MSTEFTVADAEFLAELERDLAASMAEVEKRLAEWEPELEAVTASLAAEPLLDIEPLDIKFDW